MHNKLFTSARSKLNSMKRKISEAFINNEINHEDFTTIINEEKIYRELKESIRMISSQRSDTEKSYLIEKGKKKPMMKLLDKMYRYKTMLSYCLKCKKVQKT